MSNKRPFVSKEQLETIVRQYPTPFHLYDEKGIRENARKLKQAFAWNPGFKEYFAVKATPTPAILKILREEGCGTDCSSLTELMLSDKCGFCGSEIMFSSNDTPAEEFRLAARLGATINLDDFTHIDFLKETIGTIPETISCRFNPGGIFSIGESREGFQVMDNPGEAKYGFTRPQLTEGFKKLKSLGAKHFGIHAFLASNTLSNAYYPTLAGILFQTAVELKEETGCHIAFINLSWSSKRRPAATSPSSTSPAAWASPTAPSSPPTTSWPSARACGRSMRRSWSPPAWEMWLFLPSWAALCWAPTAVW